MYAGKSLFYPEQQPHNLRAWAFIIAYVWYWLIYLLRTYAYRYMLGHLPMEKQYSQSFTNYKGTKEEMKERFIKVKIGEDNRVASLFVIALQLIFYQLLPFVIFYFLRWTNFVPWGLLGIETIFIWIFCPIVIGLIILMNTLIIPRWVHDADWSTLYKDHAWSYWFTIIIDGLFVIVIYWGLMIYYNFVDRLGVLTNILLLIIFYAVLSLIIVLPALAILGLAFWSRTENTENTGKD